MSSLKPELTSPFAQSGYTVVAAPARAKLRPLRQNLFDIAVRQCVGKAVGVVRRDADVVRRGNVVIAFSVITGTEPFQIAVEPVVVYRLTA